MVSPRPTKMDASVLCSLSMVNEGHKKCKAFYQLREWLLRMLELSFLLDVRPTKKTTMVLSDFGSAKMTYKYSRKPI